MVNPILTSKYLWTHPDTLTEDEQDKIAAYAKKFKVSSLAIRILWQRGYHSLEEIEVFFDDTKLPYHDPFLLYDMKRTIDRIKTAITANESILIYGDYDADGVTSTAILAETLEMLGANYETYIPNRFTDGYGPNSAIYNYYIDKGTTLIITVDNGVSGHSAIKDAMSKEVDVIVTDHHELPTTLPEAYAIIHPRHPDGSYPFSDLCGAGVSLKVAHALLGELPQELLDLVAIGTVADLVSLTNENRTIVKSGLVLIKQRSRISLSVLLKILGITTDDSLTEETIGFQIAPILNAVGRIMDANPLVQFLTTFDEENALEQANAFIAINEERKELVTAIFDDALKKIRQQNLEKRKFILLYSNDWHQGVLGIVASKLVELFQKPILLLTDSEESGIVKGSARSIAAVNLYQALSAAKETTIAYGGHHMAAGVSLKKEKITDLEEKLESFVSSIPFSKEEKMVDIILPIDQITSKTIKMIDSLRPFGTGFVKPLVEIDNVVFDSVKIIGALKNHLKLTNSTFNTIAFGFSQHYEELNARMAYNCCGYLSLNRWMGKETPQLILIDFNSEDELWLDKRKSKFDKDLLKTKNAVLLYETTKIGDWLLEHIDDSSIVQPYSGIDTANWKDKKCVILIECPLISLKNRLEHDLKGYVVWLVAYPFYNYLKRPMPSRNDFKLMYKTLSSKPKWSGDDIHQLRQTFLKKEFSADKFNLILQVFSQLKFVTITDGWLSFNYEKESKKLSDAEAYQKRQVAITEQRFYQFESLEKIKSHINN
ncbi:MAG TPA: single-stranded-DNA-specific exonuclease RecJ [Bavariicoccus seileri]|uniref:Single-stranded-DNA-specific exonuclease RecJ n=1 Tax=Bavariicoccus seileri TaxID=549685 RepID=A0A3D4S402_9ENTE|nr:single-stranded-DNA-specific exonuclease RecJ [Bavariicoccus seileri]